MLRALRCSMSGNEASSPARAYGLHQGGIMQELVSIQRPPEAFSCHCKRFPCCDASLVKLVQPGRTSPRPAQVLPRLDPIGPRRPRATSSSWSRPLLPRNMQTQTRMCLPRLERSADSIAHLFFSAFWRVQTSTLPFFFLFMITGHQHLHFLERFILLSPYTSILSSSILSPPCFLSSTFLSPSF